MKKLITLLALITTLVSPFAASAVSISVPQSTAIGQILTSDSAGHWIIASTSTLNYQPTGNYITGLTGDITASGPGSAAATLPTVNSNVGTFQGITVNGKGLVTGATNQSYVTQGTASSSFVTYPYGSSTYQAAGNYLTGLNTNPLQATYFSATSTVATSTFPNLEGTLSANDFSGADIGAKLNTAYAALQAQGGVVTIQPGFYPFSTEIVQATNGKKATVRCAPGGATILDWTGSATSTFINNGYTAQMRGYGFDGCTWLNSGGANAVAIEMGGSNGAMGLTLSNFRIDGFGKGIVTGNNTWNELFQNGEIQNTPRAIEVDGTSNSGEGVQIDHVTVADCSTTGSTVSSCVYFPNGATSGLSITNSQFDDAGVDIEDGNVNANLVGDYFENPFWYGISGKYTFLTLSPTGGSYSTVGVKGTTFYNDATTTLSGHVPDAYIIDGTNLALDSDSSENDHGISVPAFVYAVNTGFQSVIASNMRSIAGAYSAIATTSLTFDVDGALNLISANAPWNGITIHPSNGAVGNAGFGIWSSGGLNLISSTSSPTTNPSDPTEWPFIVNNPNSINGSSTGIGFSVSTGLTTAIGGGVGLIRQGSGSYGDLGFYTENNSGVMNNNMTVASTGYVGIASTTPGSVLSIDGPAGFLTPLLTIASSTTSLTDLTVKSNGNVGIGTSSPEVSLQVVNQTAAATTSVELGTSGQGKGSCLIMYDNTGTKEYVSIVSGAFYISTSKCN